MLIFRLILHYLISHLEKFPDNLSDDSEEYGERFNQDMKIIEETYQGPTSQQK